MILKSQYKKIKNYTEGDPYYTVFPGNKHYAPIISANGTGLVVRTLQISNGAGNAIVQLIRVDNNNNVCFSNKIKLTPYNYVVLWQGFIYFPANMSLYCNVEIDDTSDNAGVYFQVSAIQVDSNTSQV